MPSGGAAGAAPAGPSGRRVPGIAATAAESLQAALREVANVNKSLQPSSGGPEVSKVKTIVDAFETRVQQEILKRDARGVGISPRRYSQPGRQLQRQSLFGSALV